MLDIKYLSGGGPVYTSWSMCFFRTAYIETNQQVLGKSTMHSLCFFVADC
jgi:hypothetical protein